MMKKLYLFFAVLCALLGTQVANAAFTGGNTYYLKVNHNDWKNGNERFAAYFWDGSGSKWYSMTAVSGQSDLYSCTIQESETYNKVLFARFDENNQKNEGVEPWNKTKDLGYYNSSNMFEVNKKEGNLYDGSWSTYNGGGTVDPDDPDDPTYPTKCYLVGGAVSTGWNCTQGIELTGSDGIFTGSVDFTANTFCVATGLANDNNDGGWTYLNNTHRYAENTTLSSGVEANMTKASQDNQLSYTISQAGKYTVTVNFKTMKILVTKNGGGNDGPIVITGVNMPLKPEDFKDSNGNPKKHYFVIGTRMSEWRLQPEWELTAENGYALNNRLLYVGMMGIAMVDNYNDYVNHKYTWYSSNNDSNYVLKSDKFSDNSETISLKSKGNGEAIRYNNAHGIYHDKNTIIWAYDGELNEDGIRLSTPTLVKEIKLSLNSDGTPNTLKFTGTSREPEDLAPYMTFSLVGDGIFNADIEVMTPLRHQSGFNITTWQESWIQFDENNMPYIDGNGDALYQTCFQPEWLSAHPTRFKDNEGFYYDSDGLLFVYDPTTTQDDSKIGGAGETVKYFSGGVEYVKGNGDGYRDLATHDNDAKWQCFVVKNMWMNGEFKVWTGWGGANKTKDNSNAENPHNARWYFNNGGHQTENTPYVVSASPGDNVYYGTRRDVNGANFKVAKRTQFDRVELWWDPTNAKVNTGIDDGSRDKNGGFDYSFIKLITYSGSPRIEIYRTDKNHISYKYYVSNPNENNRVKSCKIIRRRYDFAGGNKLDSAQVYYKTYAYSDNMLGKNINSGDANNDGEYDLILDPAKLPTGLYEDYIIIEYYGEQGTSQSSDFTMQAPSNRVPIYGVHMPDQCTAKQLAYTKAEGGDANIAPDDATNKYWSFDVRLTAKAPKGFDKIMREKPGYTDQSVLTLIKNYVVTLPSVENLYTSIEIEGVAADDVASKVSGNKITVDPITSDGSYRMPDITLRNVLPTTYTFTFDMTHSDDDDGQWEALDVVTTTADVEMYVPTTNYEFVGFEMSKCVPAKTVDQMSSDFYVLMGSSESMKKYSNANKVSTTDGGFAPLMVTNGVLTDWNIDYSVTAEVNPDVKEHSRYVYDLKNLNKKALNIAVSADIDYLPLDYNKTQITLPNEFGNVNVYSRMPKSSKIQTSTTVTYCRVDKNPTGLLTHSTSGAYSIDMNPVDIAYANLMGEYDVKKGKDANNALTTDGQYNYQPQGSYNFEEEIPGSKYGTTTYFTNAFASFQWEPNTKLHNAAGFFSVSSQHECYDERLLENGYTVIDDDGIGYKRVPFPAVGGDVHRDSQNEEFCLDYNDGDNVAEVAAAAGKLPIKVWHVGDGEGTPTTTLYTVLTADYPVFINPTLIAEIKDIDVATVAEGNSVEVETDIPAKMISLSYPQLLTQYLGETTTDITDIVVDGASDFRIYPNPAVDVVNVAASAALGTIEIYSVDGRLVKTVEADDTRAAIEVGDLAKGNYIVRAAGAVQQMIKK